MLKDLTPENRKRFILIMLFVSAALVFAYSLEGMKLPIIAGLIAINFIWYLKVTKVSDKKVYENPHKEHYERNFQNNRIFSEEERTFESKESYQEFLKNNTTPQYDEQTRNALLMFGFSDLPSRQELKSAYRRFAKKYHPDMAKTNWEKNMFNKIMVEANKNYEILKIRLRQSVL